MPLDEDDGRQLRKRNRSILANEIRSGNEKVVLKVERFVDATTRGVNQNNSLPDLELPYLRLAGNCTVRDLRKFLRYKLKQPESARLQLLDSRGSVVHGDYTLKDVADQYYDGTAADAAAEVPLRYDLKKKGKPLLAR